MSYINLLSLLSGPVPNSLAAFLERTDAPDAKDPPNKRRKLADRAPRRLSELNGVSEAGLPNGFIPLTRVNLHLVRDRGLHLALMRGREWLDCLLLKALYRIMQR